jgi:hypothetical protein
MTVIAIETQNQTLKELIETTRELPVFLTEGGEIRYALIAVDEADVEAYSLGNNEEFIAYMQAVRERASREGTVSLEEMCRAGGG